MSDENTEIATQASAADYLALLEQSNDNQDNKAIAAVTKTNDFLPYLQLFGSNSKEVKRGEFPMGHFAVVKDKKRTDLGRTFSFLVIAWRPKAMQYAPEVLAYYDHNSPEFKRIQDLADTKDSNKGFGPEFLIWIPSVESFATFFFGNKSSRKASPDLIAIINGPQGASRNATVTAELIEFKKGNNEYSWHAPKVSACDLALSPMPDINTLREQIAKFKDPPKQAVKEQDTDTKERG
jgi:hypothetical protein